MLLSLVDRSNTFYKSLQMYQYTLLNQIKMALFMKRTQGKYISAKCFQSLLLWMEAVSETMSDTCPGPEENIPQTCPLKEMR